MIEIIDNAIQLVLTGVCTLVALINVFRRGGRGWLLLSLFSGTYFMGDLNWILFLVFYHNTPRFTYISDLSWDTAYLFLLLLLLYVADEERRRDPLREDPVGGRQTPVPHHLIHDVMRQIIRRRRWLWVVPAFTIGMCALYMRHGDYVTNLVIVVFMTGLLWCSLDGLLSLRKEPRAYSGRRLLYIATLVFCFAEYGLWTCSCFWVEDTIRNPYFWFDFLLSLSFLLFLPAVRKAVEE